MNYSHVKILHLSQDEKFIDMGISTFERIGTHNELIVFSDLNLRHVKRKDIEVMSLNNIDVQRLKDKMKTFDIVILHSRFTNKLVFPRNIKVLWVGFGYDYYGLIYKNLSELYLDKTKSLLDERRSKITIKSLIKKLPFVHELKFLMFDYRRLKSMFNSYHYFAPVLNEEFDMIKKSFPGFSPKFIDWNYGTLEDDLIGGFENKKISGSNILIGNSATFANNHLELISMLSELNLNERIIICPLSYGDEQYKKSIVESGREILKDNFKPLMEFMTFEEYILTISSCSIVIMNHVRQQALGNIITMLYLGAKVFLREENPIYSFLKNEGAIIYSINELTSNPTLIDSLLTEKDIMTNKQVLKNNWSRAVIDRKTSMLIGEIVS